MRTLGLVALVLLLTGRIPAPAALDLPKEPIDTGAMVRMPTALLPLEALILRALPKMAGGRGNIHIVSEVVSQKVGTERFYLQVGPARLVRTHYKCIVFSNAGVEIVYIDYEELRPTKK